MFSSFVYRKSFGLVLLTILFIFSYPEKAQATAISKNLTPHSADTSLTERVRMRLQKSADIKAEAIDIRISRGIVVLSGTVNNLMVKDRAGQLIQQTNGVRSVVNNLVVKPTRSDKLIEKDLKKMLQHNPTTARWKIWGEVNDNVITLDGIVNSWRARKYIIQLAKGIKGVRAIQNNIEISSQPNLTDQQLEEDIKQYLKWDTRIENAQIDVIVDQKQAVLIGTVPTAFQKQLAYENAHIPGIKEVNIDNLEVRNTVSAGSERPTLAKSFTSAEKKKALRRAFDYDPRLPDDRKLQIDIRNNTAFLSGTVDNLVAKLAAGEIAAQTAGIESVENNVAIDQQIHESYPVPVTDSAILQRLNEAFQRDSYLSAKQINIQVNSGIIQISGKVDSKFEKIHAGKIASQIMGTIGVQNNLAVREGT